MKIIRFLLFVSGCLLLVACSESEQEQKLPEVLRISILPDEGKETLLRRYTPLFTYLSDELGIKYELIIPNSYKDMLEQFSTGQVDLAYFGGFTFIQAHEQSRAASLVMRDIDTRFTSYFISRVNNSSADNTNNNITDFKDRTFSFGSKLSTSGHLMPRYFLNEKQIIPEEFFSQVMYSGKHDKTIFDVRDGKADLGAVNAKIYNKLVENKVITNKELQIIWETPPYPDYVWALQYGFSPAVAAKIQNVFLSLSPDNPKHAVILKGIDATGFLPAAVSDFQQLYNTSRKLGMLEVSQ